MQSTIIFYLLCIYEFVSTVCLSMVLERAYLFLGLKLAMVAIVPWN